MSYTGAIWKLRLYNLNIPAICYLPSLSNDFGCHVTKTSPASAVDVLLEEEEEEYLPLLRPLRLSDNRWRKTLSSEESKIFNDSRHSRGKEGEEPAFLMSKRIENGVDNYDNYS
ncbi:hypothetical protein AVEN_157762-1 [Araneus ventricosus]|uniref:Uncharacterized protein n=1 Tax=Araneus ventricosus TaxID=182803 RepID=A0A4Y2F0M7_ARAVE|nr:hypothetical protein AVEN_157762-1 [Araneus ventricosus]